MVSDMLKKKFINVMNSREEPQQKRNKHLRDDMRIKVIVENFENQEIMEYLKGVVHNFAMGYNNSVL